MKTFIVYDLDSKMPVAVGEQVSAETARYCASEITGTFHANLFAEEIDLEKKLGRYTRIGRLFLKSWRWVYRGNPRSKSDPRQCLVDSTNKDYGLCGRPCRRRAWAQRNEAWRRTDDHRNIKARKYSQSRAIILLDQPQLFHKRGASAFRLWSGTVLDDNYGVRSTIAEWSERRAGIGPFERSSVIYFEWRKLEPADDAQFRWPADARRDQRKSNPLERPIPCIPSQKSLLRQPFFKNRGIKIRLPGCT
jgi:hypothetical protein